MLGCVYLVFILIVPLCCTAIRQVSQVSQVSHTTHVAAILVTPPPPFSACTPSITAVLIRFPHLTSSCCDYPDWLSRGELLCRRVRSGVTVWAVPLPPSPRRLVCAACDPSKRSSPTIPHVGGSSDMLGGGVWGSHSTGTRTHDLLHTRSNLVPFYRRLHATPPPSPPHHAHRLEAPGQATFVTDSVLPGGKPGGKHVKIKLRRQTLGSARRARQIAPFPFVATTTSSFLSRVLGRKRARASSEALNHGVVCMV